MDGRRHQQVAVRALAGATDAAAQLIQLRQAEQIRAVDDDGVGARNVEAAFDDRGGDQDVEFAFDEIEHCLLERAFRHPPVTDDDARFRHQRLQAIGALVQAFDAVVDVENLAAA